MQAGWECRRCQAGSGAVHLDQGRQPDVTSPAFLGLWKAATAADRRHTTLAVSCRAQTACPVHAFTCSPLAALQASRYQSLTTSAHSQHLLLLSHRVSFPHRCRPPVRVERSMIILLDPTVWQQTVATSTSGPAVTVLRAWWSPANPSRATPSVH